MSEGCGQCLSCARGLEPACENQLPLAAFQPPLEGCECSPDGYCHCGLREDSA